MSTTFNVSESGLVKRGAGRLKGMVINSHNAGTVKITDGVEAGTNAVGTFTSTGALAAATHATSEIVSSGVAVPATHAVTVFTSGGTQFKDAVKASAILTSNGSQPTAGQAVVLGDITYTFVALGGAMVNTSTAVNVPLGNTTTETMNNLYNAFLYNPLVDTVRTSGLVITLTAKTAGAAGNTIAATENSATLDFDGANTTLTGGLSAETVTIGTRVYTFKDAITSTASATACEVKIGVDVETSLMNLRKAINNTGTPGLEYSFVNIPDANVVAPASDATTVTLRGRVPGLSLNTVATTETCADASFADTTLGGGTGASDAGVTTGAATITIDTTVYTFVDALSETYGAVAVPFQVLAGANAAAALDNFKSAINATGTPGTEYSTGTTAHPKVVATTNTDTVQTIRARVVGAGYNAIATTETFANWEWADTTLGGGTGNSDAGITTANATFTIGTRTYTFVVELTETLTGVAVADQILYVTSVAVALDNMKKAINGTGVAGTDYSTGTLPNADVIATTNANDSQVVQARLAGAVGNAIVTTETIANHAWGAGTLATGAGPTSTVMFNTMTLSAVATTGERYVDFKDAEFTKGLFVTIGGTAADLTFEVDTL